MSGLPLGWVRTSLAELLLGIEAGKSFKCDEWPPTKKEVGVVKVSAVTWGEYDEQESKTCTDPARVNDKLLVRKGDFLFSRANTVELVGACVIAKDVSLRVMLSDKILRLRFVDDEHKLWALHFLRSQDGRKQIEQLASGNQESMRNIGQERIGQICVPLPPRAEQTRIVEKLEELLGGLDVAVAELKAAQRKLTHYRQSLLKAAMEGALTEAWRSSPSPCPRSGQGEVGRGLLLPSDKSTPPQPSPSPSAKGREQETGTDLLHRILQERRTRWEAKQQAKFAQTGKTPPKGWQAKYPEPVTPDTTDLPVLPEGWVWASVDQLTEFVTSGSRGWAEYYSNVGAMFIRSQDINKDRLDIADAAFVNPPANSEGARTRVQRNDLLLTITGANVGKAARVEIELEEAYVSQHVALIRLIDQNIGAYLHPFLICKAGGRGQLDKMAYGAGKPGLNLQQVLSVAVPVPSPEEMSQILATLDAQVAAIKEQETAITHSLHQAAAQRRNLLRAAFSGQLVPQDPNDEPASELLARIRAAKADNARPAAATKRGRKPKGNT